MKVLYAIRLFSGLDSTVMTKRWEPTGVPTIHKVIDALDKRADLEIILACKDGISPWRRHGRHKLRIKGLRASVTVLGGTVRWPKSLHRFGRAWREVWHAAAIYFHARRTRPDVVYIDHANVLAGALIARMSSIPVLFRVMGVYPVMRQTLSRRRATTLVMRWAYRSPFSYVLCTEDGSGVRPWLEVALSPRVDRGVLINGVDDVADTNRQSVLSFPWPHDRTVVLFVGKLEHAKGCEEFLEGFLSAYRTANAELHAIVIGVGSRKVRMTEMVVAAGASNAVLFCDRVPHAEILEIQLRSDIYVSLNRLGNLSNSNLEAMRAGAAIILPRRLPEIGTDDPTHELVPLGSVATISDPDDVVGLAAAILELHRSPDKRKRLSDAIRRAALKRFQRGHSVLRRK